MPKTARSPHADAPTAVLTVRAPTLYPLPAAVGDDLAVWPGHPTHSLAVCRPDGSLRAHRACDLPALRRAIAQLLIDGAVAPASEASAEALVGLGVLERQRPVGGRAAGGCRSARRGPAGPVQPVRPAARLGRTPLAVLTLC